MNFQCTQCHTELPGFYETGQYGSIKHQPLACPKCNTLLKVVNPEWYYWKSAVLFMLFYILIAGFIIFLLNDELRYISFPFIVGAGLLPQLIFVYLNRKKPIQLKRAVN